MRKLYKRVTVDVMETLAPAVEKQSEAIEFVHREMQENNAKIVTALNNATQSFGVAVIDLFQYLNAKERQALYGLVPQLDIKDIDRESQTLLDGILHRLLEDEGERRTDCQRDYIMTIRQRMGIGGIPKLEEPSKIMNINSMNLQKLFFQIVLGFFYLQDGDELTEEQENFLNMFSLNATQKEEIEYAVAGYYNVMGPERFAKSYSLSDEMIREDNVENAEQGMREDGEPLETEQEMAAPILDSTELEEITLSGILRIDEGKEQMYRNQIVHFDAKVTCGGKLCFDSCILHYGENNDFADIVMRKSAFFELKNCQVFRHSSAERAFIAAENLGAQIQIENCELNSCSYFIRSGNGNIINIKKCQITDAGKRFIFGAATVLLAQCEFLFSENLPSSDSKTVRPVIDCHELTMENTSFQRPVRSQSTEAADNTKSDYLFSASIYDLWHGTPSLICTGDQKIICCSFAGIDKLFQSHGTSDVKQSVFENCAKLFSKAIVSDCRFDHCTDIAGSNSKLIDCQFNDCYEHLIVGSAISIQFCEFNNWEGSEKDGDSMMSFFYGSGSKSHVENCTFNGIRAHKNFVIRASADKKSSFRVVSVNRCVFENCTSQRDSKQLIKYMDHDQTFVSVTDCQGLDQINTGSGQNDDVKKKTKSSLGGAIIGAIAGLPTSRLALLWGRLGK